MEREDIQWVKKELEKNKRELWETYGYVSAVMGRYDVDGMHLLYFIVCLTPKSPGFGRGVGAFEYKGTVYWFHYDVSENKMIGLEEVAVETREGTEKGLCFRETSFGQKAFWNNGSTMDEGEKALCTLMEALAAHVRFSGYQPRLIRTAYLHEKWEAEKQAEVIRNNSVYGIT